MNNRYILLPRGALRPSPHIGSLLRRVSDLGLAGQPLALPGLATQPFRLVDSPEEEALKLVELSPEAVDAINRSPGPLRAVPEVLYRLPDPQRFLLLSSRSAVGTPSTFVVRCLDAVNGGPLRDQHVIAFDDFATRSGVEDWTDAAGEVRLTLPTGTIDRLYVPPHSGFWGAFRAALPIQSPIVLMLEPCVATHADAIRRLYPPSHFVASTGIRVGVVDTGVGPHADLNLVGGRCTVTGQPANSFGDVDVHGTHVAGLIGGNGATGLATRGLAPSVEILSYRVFDHSQGGLVGSNYAILKAMILAAGDGCDIINLSLSSGPYDAIVEESIRDAREQGMLVVVSAGNDERSNVSYPAAYAGATAVSAMGAESGFPRDCYFAGDVLRPPYATVVDEYLAEFSNVGPQIACTGLGSGVLSTLPGNAFGPMSGTSMAAPMVAGAAASLLSRDLASFQMARNRARSDAIERLLQSNCVRRFGGGIWEGYGIPDPASV